MPTQSIPLGPAVTLLAGIPYAVPGVNCVIHTDAAGATFTQSNTLEFASSSPVTLTGGVGNVTGAFIKAAANALVVLKKA